jgi:hypothetical protein
MAATLNPNQTSMIEDIRKTLWATADKPRA